jgi:hypothetical protein
MSKQQAGSKGGRATVAKHGREHMQQIGKRGAWMFVLTRGKAGYIYWRYCR